MTPKEPISNTDEFRAELNARTHDVRTLDLEGFRRWLALHLERWQSDPVFIQRCLIRNLRRTHPHLGRLEREHREATAADAASESGTRIRELDRQIHNASRAIEGLQNAIASAETNLRVSFRAKRDAFVKQSREHERERAILVETSQIRQDLLQMETSIELLRNEMGLVVEEARLSDLQSQHGRGTARAGTEFEQTALELTREFILPLLDRNPDSVEFLRRVRLGAAGVEFDLVVIERTTADQSVDVLAVVEAKRNINDLGHGFARRQIDLTWLTGDTAHYEPDRFQTKHFSLGHFDRPAVHRQAGQDFVFAPASFRRFVRDSATERFLDLFYLITRVGDIWGISNAALAQMAARIATDEKWNPDDEAYLVSLFEFCLSLCEETETPDVLAHYRSSAKHARQLLVLDNQSRYSTLTIS